MKVLFLSVAIFLISAAGATAQGYRIFISADMEGISGAVTSEQITPGGREYDRFRKIMTAEVAAAIEGAREAGATEFMIADSHGNMQNLVMEDLPPDIRSVRGEPRPLSMMQGIQDGKYDGIFFIGYHAGASNPRGVRAHTMSSARLSEVKLNGVAASEGYWNAAIGGELGIPVLLVTGDDVVTEEISNVLGTVEVVAVKKAIGFHAADSLMPRKAQGLIRAAAKRAVQNIGQYKPFKITAPVAVDLTFHYYRPAEALSWLPPFRRTGARSISFESDTMADASRFLEFITVYSIELTP